MSDLSKAIIVSVLMSLVASTLLFLMSAALWSRDPLVGINSLEKVSYNIIGTPTASSTLTSAFSSNTLIIDSKNFTKLALDVRYSPRNNAQNKFMAVLVEVSNDDGLNFFPLVIPVDGVTSSVVYSASSSASGLPGQPIVIPAGETLVASGTYQASIIRTILADKIKISVKENATTTFGNAYVRATLTNN